MLSMIHTKNITLQRSCGNEFQNTLSEFAHSLAFNYETITKERIPYPSLNLLY